MESAHEDGYQVDDYDLRSIIIEVLQDGNPRGYITRRRAEQQRKAAARDREEKEDYYEGRYRMSPEDGQAYEETRTPNDLEKYGGVSEEEMAAQQAEAEEAAREQREADEAKTSAIIDEVLAKEEAELGAPLEVDYEMTPGGALKGYAELEPKTAPKKAAPKKGRASLREGEAALRDSLVDVFRAAGVEVAMDGTGQGVLDWVNEREKVRMQAKLSLLDRAARVIHNWIARHERGKVFTIELPQATRRMIRNVMGRDFDSHTITSNGIRHGLNNHGVDGRKLNPNSIPIREEDAELIPYIMTAPDYVRKGSEDVTGRESVCFYKKLSNGYVVVVEKEYKNSPNDMETITIWAEMSSEAINAQRRAVPDTHVLNAILSTDAAKIRKDAEDAIRRDKESREHRVFHGSGAEFEEFDHSHMGEGEGAQAYGWGTYVTEVEGIGQTYAEANAGNQELTDSEIEDFHLRVNSELMERFGITDWEAFDFLYNGDGFEYFDISHDEAVVEALRSYFEAHPNELDVSWYDFTDADDVEMFLDEAQRTLVDMGEEAFDRLLPDGFRGPMLRFLYTVEIPEDNGSNYLHWEDSLTMEQLKRIEEGLKDMGWKRDADGAGNRFVDEEGDKYILLEGNRSGEDIYNDLEGAFGSDKAASLFLSSIGFTGVSMPAEYRTGGREDGARNYVIFNEKDAQITDHVRFFRTANGVAYGFTVGGKVYLDPEIATAETVVHELTHLWGDMLRKRNPKEWENVVKLMKGTSVWEEVKSAYPELKGDDEIADEVLAHFSGRRGAERLREAQRKVAREKGLSMVDRASAVAAIERVKDALNRFWRGVADLLGIHFKSAEEVADAALADILNGRVTGGSSVSKGLRLALADTKNGTDNAPTAIDKNADPSSGSETNSITGANIDNRIEVSNDSVGKLDGLVRQIRNSGALSPVDFLLGLQKSLGSKNGHKNDMLVHRFVGAVRIDGQEYLVKTTMHEHKQSSKANRQYAYDVTKIAVLNVGTSSTATGLAGAETDQLPLANVLNDFEKSYDSGKKLLEESKKEDERLFEGGELRSSRMSSTGVSGVDDASYREVPQGELLGELRRASEEGRTVRVYRTMQVIDGKLYSPMAKKVAGEETSEIKFRWAAAEEHPELAKRGDGSQAMPNEDTFYIKIDKGLDKGTLTVAYNPYTHTSRTVLNDQFSSAFARPNLPWI